MRTIAAVVVALACLPAAARAQDPQPRLEARADSAAAWGGLLPGARAAGQGRLTVWGFEVYDASLWVAPDFRQAGFERHAFALELSYLRAFSARDIAQRSVAEMRRSGGFDAAQALRWQAALEAVLPDVRRGDRVTGVHRPGVGAAFLVNNRPVGEVADTEFARLFFGIWLGAQTSEPALRARLLTGTPP